MSENNNKNAAEQSAKTAPQNGNGRTVAIKFEMSNEAFSQMHEMFGRGMMYIANALENRTRYDYEIEKAKMNYELKLLEYKKDELQKQLDEANEKLSLVSDALNDFAKAIKSEVDNADDDDDDGDDSGNGDQNPEPEPEPEEKDNGNDGGDD